MLHQLMNFDVRWLRGGGGRPHSAQINLSGPALISAYMLRVSILGLGPPKMSPLMSRVSPKWTRIECSLAYHRERVEQIPYSLGPYESE